MKLRVSFIDFLNSVPLGWSFVHGDRTDAFELKFDVPSECARNLARGDADVGLIPVIEYQKIAGLRILPDISISSTHEVRSVLFVSKVPLERVRTVAMDTSSRTSAALLQILLFKFHGREDISYLPHPPDPDKMLAGHDGALIIGNPALRTAGRHLYALDLASEWYRFTGLPFVFAFWAIRSGVNLGEQVALFYRSKSEGLSNIDAIAQLYSSRLGLSPQVIRTYLQEHLDFSLDSPRLKALQTFFELAKELELIEGIRPIQFYSPAVTEVTQDAH